MDSSTLMVVMQIGRPNDGLLGYAVELARKLDAGVVGVAASEVLQLTYGDAYISGDLIEANRDLIVEPTKAAEAEFRTAFADRAGYLDWRSEMLFTPSVSYLAREARCADLVVTSVASGTLFDGSPRTSTGELLMQLGRPMLVVPTKPHTPRFDRMMVAWKDTRETRRATLDALPLLRQARSVSIVAVAAPGEHAETQIQVADVARWLGRHGVVAREMALRSDGPDPAQITAVAAELDTDVIVAGAYGHSRLREWVLGGVTRELLLHEDRCSLLSH